MLDAPPALRLMLTTDAVGGVWRYTLELAACWAANGVQPVLVVMGPRPDAEQRREAEAVPGLRLVVSDLPLDWLAPTPAALRDAAHELAALAVKVRADAVHLHTPALVADAEWPCPVVAVAHSCVGTWWRAVHGGALPPDLAWRAEAVAQGLAAADAVIAPSRSFADDLAMHYGCRRRIEILRNGRRANAVPAGIRSEIFTAGRLWDSGKNVAVIDTAAGRLDGPVLAAGAVQGPHGARIACQHLRCLGTLDEAAMAERFAAATVFLSLSIYEPFGLAVLEAAQAGCALILSDIPTFRELWDGAAVFVDPRDAAALADAISDILHDPQRRDRLADAARQRAALFTAKAMAAGTLAVHHAVLSATAAGAMA